MFGLALTGGGARCAAQAGVLLALEEEGFLPSAVAGCGAGAWIAALYALGLDGEALREAVLALCGELPRLLRTDRSTALELLRGARPTGALYTPDALLRALRFQTLDAVLCDARLPLAMATWDVEGGALQVLASVLPQRDRGPAWNRQAAMADAGLSAMALPGLLPPVAWRGRRLTGGNGLSASLSGILHAMGVTRILRVEVLAPGLSPYVRDLPSLLMANQARERYGRLDSQVLCVPLPTQAGILDGSWAARSIEAGYRSAKQELPMLMASLRAQGRVLPFKVR